MEDIEPNVVPSDSLPDVPEGTRDLFLDLLLAHWPQIAATAWEGYLTKGRGAVTIESGSVPPEVGYYSGSPCRCHDELVASYDPEAVAVVAVIRSATHVVAWIAPLGGVPTPVDAAGAATATQCGRTAH
ncbi:MAG: hypothetical protein ABI629_19350 [bacterium]